MKADNQSQLVNSMNSLCPGQGISRGITSRNEIMRRTPFQSLRGTISSHSGQVPVIKKGKSDTWKFLILNGA